MGHVCSELIKHHIVSSKIVPIYFWRWVRKIINDGVGALTRKSQARFQIIEVLCSGRTRVSVCVRARWCVHACASVCLKVSKGLISDVSELTLLLMFSSSMQSCILHSSRRQNHVESQ